MGKGICGKFTQNIKKILGCHFQHQTFDKLNFLIFSDIIY